MSDKCPTCKGPVEVISECERLGRHVCGPNSPDDVYRSTAAEQLAIHNTLMGQGADKITELRQQLADKERECKGLLQELHNEGYRQCDRTHAHTPSQLELTAANVVVEAIEDFETTKKAPCTHGHPPAAFADGVACFDCDDLHRESWFIVRDRLAKYRKLQGGDGDGPKARDM